MWARRRAQLTTSSGQSYYVGTKLDAFVYDTLAAWYCEDDSAANCQTMPAAAATVRPQRAPAGSCRAVAVPVLTRCS